MEPSATSEPGRLYGALGTGAVLAGALAYIGLADPHRPGFLFPRARSSADRLELSRRAVACA